RPIASSEVPIGRRMKMPEMFIDQLWPESVRRYGRTAVNGTSHSQRSSGETVDPPGGLLRPAPTPCIAGGKRSGNAMRAANRVESRGVAGLGLAQGAL